MVFGEGLSIRLQARRWHARILMSVGGACHTRVYAVPKVVCRAAADKTNGDHVGSVYLICNILDSPAPPRGQIDLHARSTFSYGGATYLAIPGRCFCVVDLFGCGLDKENTLDENSRALRTGVGFPSLPCNGFSPPGLWITWVRFVCTCRRFPLR